MFSSAFGRRKLTPNEEQKLIPLFFEYKLASTPTGIIKNGKRHDPEITKQEILAIDPYFFIKREEREKAKKESEGQGIAYENSELRRRRPLSIANIESRPLISSNDIEECDETKQTCCDKITGICKKLVGLGGKTRRKYRKQRKNKRKKTRGKRYIRKSRRF